MSPKKPVENLRVLCSKLVMALTLDIIRCSGNKCIEDLGVHLSRLPRTLKEELILDILDLTQLNSTSKWVSFCAFQTSCPRFDFRNLSSKFHEKFADLLENVCYLNLTEAQISEKSLRRLISKCPLLRSLIIPNFATDLVMQEIKILQNLELLDISGNTRVSQEGWKCLTNKSLQILVIGASCNVQTLSDILMQLPHLREVRNYQGTAQALLQLKVVTKLQCISDSDTNTERMLAIISICPELQELSLEDPLEDSLDMLVQELSSLKKLRISYVHNCKSPLKITRKLTLLILEAKNLSLDLNTISIALEYLSMKSCHLYASDLYLRNLRVLELIECDVKKELVIELLENCAQLRRIAISHDIGLTDADVKKLCKAQKLKQLEELWLSLAKQLSSDSVILLMNHCERLTLLGTLNGWNVEKIEINYLRCVIYFANINLNLLYFNCF
ncbi:F-box/LRR-repeat protein 2-like [Euwallacea fornicatus]|uniref:F-box/LRR-repeat protein 2-like n=1 Tax=Euwallacea fornicatus TaxID=995702 RepID=UPI0033901697